MRYKLAFHPDALAQWRKLDATASGQFKKNLAERLQHPRVPAARMAGHEDRYQIKLRSVGYRLVYEVWDANGAFGEASDSGSVDENTFFGCGTSRAEKHAMRRPAAEVTRAPATRRSLPILPCR